MERKRSSLFSVRYPQNYILKNPYMGFLAIALFSFLFVTIYHPADTHESQTLSYAETMAIYCFSAAISALIFILLIKRIPYFSKREEWNFGKEIMAILLVLVGMGIAIYFMAFIMEPPADRWNIPTFLDSFLNAFLVGIIPLAFFSLVNVQYLINRNYVQYMQHGSDGRNGMPGEEKIFIKSKLKKQDLEFFPSQFLYAESDGNYVAFHLIEEGKIVNKVIRNSISNIEMQLSGIPSMLRVHRAFIVNLKKVQSKHGNTSGYRLSLKNGDREIPVSRQNTLVFDRMYEKFSGQTSLLFVPDSDNS
jgi:hypothetical protein